MKYLLRQMLYTLAMIISIQSQCSAKLSQEFHQSYKKINEELISIRKEFSPTQPKVYFLLDQVEKVNRIIQETLVKKNNYKKKCRDLSTQTDILKNKNLLLKEKVLVLQNELEKTTLNLAQEQSLNSVLRQEKEQLKQPQHKHQINPRLPRLRRRTGNLKASVSPQLQSRFLHADL
jgi:chromosome segregation ATPase